MLETVLTTKICSQIISLLIRRRWSVARIARVIGNSSDYVQRVQNKQQSFQMADVEALANACKQEPYRLVFDSFERSKLPPEMRGLYDLTEAEVQRHDEFKRVLMRKPSKKRRPRTKAA